MARVRSVVLVDFDNVPFRGELTTSIGNWMQWLADGAHAESGHRRKWIAKRVYWAPLNDKHRPYFEAEGFEAFSCSAYAQSKKSTADMVIAMDAIEFATSRTPPDEVIVITADTDFLALTERLQQHGVRVVTAGRSTDRSLALFRKQADSAISWEALKSAQDYTPQRRPWWSLKRPEVPLYEFGGPPATDASEAPSDTASESADTGLTQLDQAAERVIKLGEAQPNHQISQKRVVNALRSIDGFHNNPMRRKPAAWLGCGSYRSLMKRLAKENTRITVRHMGNGGVAVSVRVEA